MNRKPSPQGRSQSGAIPPGLGKITILIPAKAKYPASETIIGDTLTKQPIIGIKIVKNQ